MPSKLMYGRDPFPNPKEDNDADLAKQKKQKELNSEPVHLAQQADPWNRLNETATLQSSRRDVFHHDPLAPNDSLDFVLNAVYNHTSGYMKEKPEIVLQRETLGEDLGRKLKNREKFETFEASPLAHPLKIIETGKMEDFNSVKLAIGPQPKSGSGSVFGRKPKVVKNNNNKPKIPPHPDNQPRIY